MKVAFVIGRVIFGAFFLNGGINHLRHRAAMKPYVESKGLPAPELMVTLSAVPLLVGGTSLILGIKPKWGALAVLGFLAGVSPIMHDFWKAEDPQERQQSMTDFLKNMALAGASLALMSVEQPEMKAPGKAKVPRGSQSDLINAVRNITSEIAA
jgi:putative oxidoreductase